MSEQDLNDGTFLRIRQMRPVERAAAPGCRGVFVPIVRRKPIDVILLSGAIPRFRRGFMV